MIRTIQNALELYLKPVTADELPVGTTPRFRELMDDTEAGCLFHAEAHRASDVLATAANPEFDVSGLHAAAGLVAANTV